MSLRSPLSADEMISEQAPDDYCQWARIVMDLAQEPSPFATNQHGVLVRRSKLDGSLEIVVPTTLCRRLLDIAQNAATSGHPGYANVFQTLRRAFYWPSVRVDVHQAVKNYQSYSKNCIKDRRKVYPM